MPIPQGYCTPPAESRAYAQAIADGDLVNITLVQLDVCGTFGERYTHVKTPRGLGTLPLPREMFLTEIARELDQGTALQDAMAQADRDLDNLSDGAVDLAPSDYGYSGRDSDCVYLAGFIRLEMDGEMTKASSATCITLTNARMFSVNMYDFTDSPPSLEAMKEQARAVAMSISPQ